MGVAFDAVEIPVKPKVDSSAIKETIKDIKRQFEKDVFGIGQMMPKKKEGFGAVPGKGKAFGVKDIAEGVGIGMAAGGVIGLLSFIVDVLKDMPIITAIMKILKLLLMVLFFPLIPILKPALVNLAFVTKLLVPVMNTISKVLGLLMNAWNNFLYKMWGGVWDWLVDAGKGVWAAIVSGWEFLKDIGKWIWENILLPAWGFLKDVGIWIWENILLPAWEFLKEVGLWIWEQIIKPAWNFLKDVGLWLWNQIIKPAWDFLSSVGSWIWEQILKPAFNWLVDVGKKIWDIISEPFKWLADKVNSIIGWFGGGKKGGNVGDAVISGGKVITTDPSDYLIATKNPRELGGGGKSLTININIDKPTLQSDQDIKKLVQQIEMNLYRNIRRYNSYV